MRDNDKIIQILTYLAYKQPGHSIDPMKAYKLMWLTDRYHVRCHGRTVSGDTYYALPLGPVPTETMNILKDCGLKNFHAEAAPDMDLFSDSDIEALDLIYDTFGHLTSLQLSKLSHEFPDWKSYEELLQGLYTKKSYQIDTGLFFEDAGNTSHADLVKRVFSQSPETLKTAHSVFMEYHGV